jgi:hypothetical protein
MRYVEGYVMRYVERHFMRYAERHFLRFRGGLWLRSAGREAYDSTAKAAVSWSVPADTQPALAVRS